jgi:tetratricopeptide (TPR) repeat protein
VPVQTLRTLSSKALIALAVSLTVPFVIPAPVQADGLAGAYLAGRAATYESDFSAQAEYYTRALVRDPSNPVLMENVVFAQLAQGQIKQAIPVAQRLWQMELRSQAANMVMIADFAQRGAFVDILSRDLSIRDIHPLVDGLLTAWAHMGEGAVSAAMQSFDTLAKDQNLRPYVLYHQALALASVGDYKGAEEMFAADGEQLTRLSRQSVLARLQTLSQLGDNEKALEVLNGAFGTAFDPAIADIRSRLVAGEPLGFSIASTPVEGIAEVFFTMGSALNGQQPGDYVLMYARMAAALNPSHVDAVLLSAELLDDLGRFPLSIATYKKVPRDHPDYYAAEMGRAEALRRSAKPDASAEVLNQLAETYPDLPQVHISLGDLLRQQEDYAGAVKAYDKALALTPEDASSRWFLYYARGICHERLDIWDKAEADFRASLALEPDRPQVLNYLGYSLVEKRKNLDEALDMIERAVAARPDSGYIVDSLGWVLYRLGRYDEAVGHMERAVELMPVDPVVNDHLGDVFWAVGRKREAEFQWKRALSFIRAGEGDGEADPDRIRRKLEVGLDVVLAEEGAEPLKVANGG